MTIKLNGYEAEVFYAYLCHSMERLEKAGIKMPDVEMQVAQSVEERMDEEFNYGSYEED